MLRALVILEVALGENHYRVAHVLGNLGSVHNKQGNYTDAEVLFQRALAIEEIVLGSNHPSTAITLRRIAKLNWIQGNYADAERLLQQVLTIETSLRDNHPHVAETLMSLGGLSQAQGNLSLAVEFWRRGLAIAETNLVQILALGSETRSQAYVKNTFGNHDGCDSFEVNFYYGIIGV